MTTIPRAESDITPAWLTAVSLIQMAGAVNLGGGIAEPDPARLAIVRRSLERAPVILESFDKSQYLA